ncbi:MAG: TMEM128 family protein [Candidatus Dojkabacteria bacterium]
MFNFEQRNIFYGLSLGLGIVLLQQLAASASDFNFITGLVLLISLLITQISVTYLQAKQKVKQLDLPVSQQYGPAAEIVYHLLLPVWTLLGVAGFIYVNDQLSLWPIYFAVTIFIFVIFFTNMRAYYLDKFKTEEETHAVYDLLKLIIFFTNTNLVLNLASRFEFSFLVVAGVGFSLSGLISLLVLLRFKNLSYFNLGLILASALATGYLYSVLYEFLDVPSLLNSFYVTLIFYIFNAILHHELHKSLRLNQLLEYILVAGICFMLVLLLI